MIRESEYETLRANVDAFEAWRGDRTSYHPDEIPADVPRVTNEERSAVELYEFNRDKPERYFAYVKYPNFNCQPNTRPSYGSLVVVSTWMGDELARGSTGRAFQDNFGGWRIPFRATCVDDSGVVYSGTAMYSAGDYARLKRIKQPAPVYFNLVRGLRGCYLADEARVEVARTFAEFCAIVESERKQFDMRTTGQLRFAWEHVKAGRSLEVCVSTNHGRGEYVAKSQYGLCVSTGCESEWRKQSESDDE